MKRQRSPSDAEVTSSARDAKQARIDKSPRKAGASTRKWHVTDQVLVLGGKSDSGQLGRAVENAIWQPVVIAWGIADPVVHVSAGEEHSAVVTAGGHLYTAGSGTAGATGRDGPQARFLRVEHDIDGDVLHVACGERSTLAVLRNGLGSGLGDPSGGVFGKQAAFSSTPGTPTPITRTYSDVETEHDSPGSTRRASVMNLVSLQSGKTHAVGLTRDGAVVTWGDWRLMHRTRSHAPLLVAPMAVRAFHTVSIVQVAAGDHHCVALTADGHAFAWGENDQGQLGVGNGAAAAATSTTTRTTTSDQDRMDPVEIDAFRGDRRAVSVAAGGFHTLFVASDGNVLATGRGREGQLGCDDDQSCSRPKRIPGLDGAHISTVACGKYHSLALSSSNGRVFAFGQGTAGALLTGDAKDRFAPTRVPLPTTIRVPESNGPRPDGPVVSAEFSPSSEAGHMWPVAIAAGSFHSIVTMAVVQSTERDAFSPVCTSEQCAMEAVVVERNRAWHRSRFAWFDGQGMLRHAKEHLASMKNKGDDVDDDEEEEAVSSCVSPCPPGLLEPGLSQGARPTATTTTKTTTTPPYTAGVWVKRAVFRAAWAAWITWKSRRVGSPDPSWLSLASLRAMRLSAVTRAGGTEGEAPMQDDVESMPGPDRFALIRLIHSAFASVSVLGSSFLAPAHIVSVAPLPVSEFYAFSRLDWERKKALWRQEEGIRGATSAGGVGARRQSRLSAPFQSPVATPWRGPLEAREPPPPAAAAATAAAAAETQGNERRMVEEMPALDLGPATRQQRRATGEEDDNAAPANASASAQALSSTESGTVEEVALLSGLDVAAVRSSYDLLLESGETAVLAALRSSMRLGGARLAANPPRERGALRALLILLLFPRIGTDDALLAHLAHAMKRTTVVLRRTVLEWIRRLPSEHFATIVEGCHAWLGGESSRTESDRMAVLVLMERLFQLNSWRGTPLLPVHWFYNNSLVASADWSAELQRLQQRPASENWLQLPFLIPLATKAKVLRLDAKEKMTSAVAQAVVHRATEGVRNAMSHSILSSMFGGRRLPQRGSPLSPPPSTPANRRRSRESTDRSGGTELLEALLSAMANSRSSRGDGPSAEASSQQGAAQAGTGGNASSASAAPSPSGTSPPTGSAGSESVRLPALSTRQTRSWGAVSPARPAVSSSAPSTPTLPRLRRGGTNTPATDERPVSSTASPASSTRSSPSGASSAGPRTPAERPHVRQESAPRLGRRLRSYASPTAHIPAVSPPNDPRPSGSGLRDAHASRVRSVMQPIATSLSRSAGDGEDGSRDREHVGEPGSSFHVVASIGTEGYSMNMPVPVRESDIFFVIRVRRERLLTDALFQLETVEKEAPSQLRKPMRVTFVGEEGVDAGGLTTEFFQLLLRELFLWTVDATRTASDDQRMAQLGGADTLGEEPAPAPPPAPVSNANANANANGNEDGEDEGPLEAVLPSPRSRRRSRDPMDSHRGLLGLLFGSPPEEDTSSTPQEQPSPAELRAAWRGVPGILFHADSQDNARRVWFHPDANDATALKNLRLVGTILGLAAFHGILVDVPLPLQLVYAMVRIRRARRQASSEGSDPSDPSDASAGTVRSAAAAPPQPAKRQLAPAVPQSFSRGSSSLPVNIAGHVTPSWDPLDYTQQMQHFSPLVMLSVVQPQLAVGLQQLLDFDEAKAGGMSIQDTFQLTFELDLPRIPPARQSPGQLPRTPSTRSIPLGKGGASRFVDVENREEYVQRYAEALLLDSVGEQLESFAQGFEGVMGSLAASLCEPEEIVRLITGDEELGSIATLRSHAEFRGGYTAESPPVQWLWEVLEELPEQSLRKFLAFVTGTERVPIGGLNRVRIVIQRSGNNQAHLPCSHSCFSIMDLPEYRSKETLKVRLLTALEYTEGFGLV